MEKINIVEGGIICRNFAGLEGICLMMGQRDIRENDPNNFFYFDFLIFFFLYTFRSDTSHHLRTRHVPIGSIDSEDGGVGLTDDDLQSLLPANHGISRDDLSQVSFYNIYKILFHYHFHFRPIKKILNIVLSVKE